MFQTIKIADLLNQPQNQVDFLVERFENMVEPNNISFPHKHNFYEILWITKGKSTQTIDYKDYVIADNTLFFISPGQLHLFEEWENVEGYAILFTEEFFLQIFQNKNILFELSYLDNLHENPFLKIKKEDERAIKPLIDLLIEENSSAEPSTESLRALLLVLLRRIQKSFAIQNHQKSDKHQVVIFRKFKYLVESNFTKNLTASQYASLLAISPQNLNTLIKAISGKSTSEIIKERTILEAQQLLHFSELTVSQIADRLGFEDSSYFARFFKKHVGVPPVGFRKNKS